MDKQQIQAIMTNFIQEGKKENGHTIVFGIEDWGKHYLSEEWAKAGKLLAIIFLRKNEKFIVSFIEKNKQICELDDEDIIYQLLSKTALYHIMQKNKKTMVHNSKAVASLPSLKSSEQDDSIEKIKKKATKKAIELLRYIPVIGTSDSNKMGHMLVDFINNTDNYYSKWEIPSVVYDELKEYLGSLKVLPEDTKEYLNHFKL